MNAFDFFFAHGGYSYRPEAESPLAGRVLWALELAAAEATARERGFSFEWSIDPDIDSSDFSDDPEPWSLWVAVARDEHGDIVASLGGVDFGRDGSPYSDPYARVVEAALSFEALGFVTTTGDAR